MDTKWLEDFVSLVETRSFSRSAQLRHVTQSAFSRRIQSLEAWVGADLLDRSTYPTRLTPAGEALYPQALGLLQTLHLTRTQVRGHAAAGSDVIEFAVPHTLAFSFFPAWLNRLRESFGPFKSRLMAFNVHDAVLRLTEGGCDLLIVYHHPSHPIELDVARYDMVCLGTEEVAPYSCPDASGRPIFAWPPQAGQALPYLGYGPGAYLGQVVDAWLKQAAPELRLEQIYETDMAEGLKAMALEAHGLAFLPASAVRQELHAGRLVAAARPGALHADMTLELRAYREKPVLREGQRGGAPRAAAARSKALALWDYLCAQQAC
ncbi:MAG: LysR substrate-binding domain-containing protein [Hylemonella sp.]|nr:LysR substrate-binding domain-containing protein [Hylemonella sp.]MDH5707640.1 LysR substrate-binding domain-containing protein [Hylemonella sp.]